LILFLDTRVAAFVHAGDARLFSPTAMHMLNTADDIRISPMVVLELSYLWERKKIVYPGDQIVSFLTTQYGMTVDAAGMGAGVLNATSFLWTRDPFDRTITAHAAHYGAFLLTRDQTIHDHYPAAVW
jgi:PIN domain nuclease of toxin-antitoxin system